MKTIIKPATVLLNDFTLWQADVNCELNLMLSSLELDQAGNPVSSFAGKELAKMRLLLLDEQIRDRKIVTEQSDKLREWQRSMNLPFGDVK